MKYDLCYDLTVILPVPGTVNYTNTGYKYIISLFRFRYMYEYLLLQYLVL